MGKNKAGFVSKEKEIIYTPYELISFGTFITANDKFWDHLYVLYPELSVGIVNCQVYMTHRFATEEEIKELFTKDRSKYSYAHFIPETLKEHGMNKLSSDFHELSWHWVLEGKADAIVEIDRTGLHNAIIRWHLIERKENEQP